MHKFYSYSGLSIGARHCAIPDNQRFVRNPHPIVMPITKSSRDLVDEAMEEVRTYPVAEVLQRQAEGKVLLIDVRDVRELAPQGTAQGAFHVPRGMLEFWFDPASPYYKPLLGDAQTEYILFCHAGWRSALSVKTLQDMGLTRVAHVDGGFDAWLAQGAPVESHEANRARWKGR